MSIWIRVFVPPRTPPLPTTHQHIPPPTPTPTKNTNPPVPSQDHRGTPTAPGRVVTLISRSFWSRLTDHHASAPDRVWGVAYRILPSRVAEVKDYLDIREINGYTIHYTPFHPSPSGSPIHTLVYIGTPDNDQFVGPQDPQALAEHIARSAGPSGPNLEYLFGLEAALAALGDESGDEHVTDLAERVRGVLAERGEEVMQQQQYGGFQRAGSVDEQETEKMGTTAAE